ncbi:hypothetical protein LZ318_13815 [Saccharopolyspora indica]|uniref:phenylacetate--CoA ligase family protein n=1 Tax=Saccharopolyspora indica TaxID=1229659 RepID=UPI0022EA3420|nr:hypothetical protein [Saccharopolyspora indica]MDA3647025.1 hypothetical protein [Saccharopolyspora indica]
MLPSESTAQEFLRGYRDGLLSEEDFDAWYRHRLAEVLRHVTGKSDFYREHFAGVALESVTPDDLSALPFTTKEHLREAMFSVLSGTIDEAAVYYETTGTTGAATPCPRSANEIALSNLHVADSWRSVFAARFGDRMPVIALMGPSELYAFGDTFGEVAQQLGACHVKLWPESNRVGFERALRLLEQLRVEVVVCAPALCLSLAKAAQHYGYDLREDFDIELFLVLGEICTPEFSENVASLWGAPALPTLYGSQEALAIGTGCAHRRLHLSDPNYLVEILEPGTDRVLGRTGTGELCLTMLIDGIKPLIRYRTGDLVRVGDRCDCGRAGSVVEVLGRVADGVELGGRRLQPAEIETAVLGGLRGCLGYQVVLDRAADGGDEVTVRLDLLPEVSGDTGAVAAGVLARLRELADVRAEVSVQSALDPVTHTGAYVSWKAARILDNRTAPDSATLVARQVASRYAITGERR